MGLFRSDAVFRQRVLRLLGTEFAWGVGTFFALPSTTVPAFLTARGCSPAVVGILGVAMVALPLVFQFLSRNVLDRFRDRKRGIILMHVPIILPYFLLAAADVLLGHRPGPIAVSCIALLGISQLAMGVVVPVWLDMVSRLIPLEWRGRYFGISSGAFALGGIAGSAALYYVSALAGARVYSLAFLVAGLCFVVSVAIFSTTRVPADVFDRQGTGSLFERIRAAVQTCGWASDFGRLVVSYGGVLLAAAVTPFVVVYAMDGVRGLGYPETVFAGLTVLQAMGGAVSAVVLGWIIDRHGPRWPWVCATLTIPLVVLLLPFGRNWPVLAVCALLAGVLSTHWSISAPALLELSPEGDKSGYVAMANMAAFVPATVGPLLYGGLAQRAGFEWAFAVAGVSGLAAAVPALTLRRKTVAAGKGMRGS